MRIQVLHDYAGRVTREHRIEVGEYDLYDPDLFGCGQHLLDIGVAVVIEDDTATEAEASPVTPDTASEGAATFEFKGRTVVAKAAEPSASKLKPKGKR
jgi:hypothetical protein